MVKTYKQEAALCRLGCFVVVCRSCCASPPQHRPGKRSKTNQARSRRACGRGCVLRGDNAAAIVALRKCQSRNSCLRVCKIPARWLGRAAITAVKGDAALACDWFWSRTTPPADNLRFFCIVTARRLFIWTAIVVMVAFFYVAEISSAHRWSAVLSLVPLVLERCTRFSSLPSIESQPRSRDAPPRSQIGNNRDSSDEKT
jgi:hypothetical protein